MSNRRYQECNLLEKIWRIRFYLIIPFKWLWWRIFKKKDEITSRMYWRILIGSAQIDMKWYYTEDEVEEMIFHRFRNK